MGGGKELWNYELQKKNMILTDGANEAEIRDNDWTLVSDLLSKWGYETPNKTPKNFNIKNLNDRLPELSAWGIPWKRIKYG